MKAPSPPTLKVMQHTTATSKCCLSAVLMSFLATIGFSAASAQVAPNLAKVSGRPQPDLKLSVTDVNCLAWSPDGATLASGNGRGVVKLWDTRTGALRRAFHLHAQWNVTALAYSRDSKLLVSGAGAGTVKLWNAQTGEVVRDFKQEGAETAHEADVTSLAWSPDGKTVASASEDDTVVNWDVATGAPLYTLRGHKDDVRSIAFSPDGATLASGGDDDLKLWDARTGAPQADLKPFADDVKDLAWSPDGTTIAIAVQPLIMWDRRTQQMLNKEKALPFSNTPQATVVAFSPDGSLLATGHYGDTATSGCDVRLWDAHSLALKQTFTGHKLPIEDIVFSPDGKTLASAGMEGTIKLWPVSGRRSPVTLASMLSILDPDGSHWIAMTDEGFFETSPAALLNQKWRISKETPLGQPFKSAFHRPDVLQRLLQPEPIDPKSAIGLLLAAHSAPPSVAFVSPENQVKVKGESVNVQVVASDDIAVQQLEFRVNGRPVPVSFSTGATQEINEANRERVLAGKAAPALHTAAVTYRAAIPLPPGESKILVRAIARDAGGMEGTADIFVEQELTTARGVVFNTLRGADAREAEKAFQGDLHVLSIGVSKYQNAAYNLRYPVADATSFANLWLPMKDRLYRNVVVTQLADDKATAPAIQSALNKLIETTTNKDTVLIFLAGHGMKANDQDFYFASHEIDFKQPQKTALPWTSLTDVLARVPAKRVVLFLDACHSGSALGGAQASNERMAESLVKRAGVMVFASSRGDQASLESPQWGHGAFTKAVLEGIAEGKANLDSGAGADGNITVAKLLVYLQARVPKLTGDQQHPACPLMQDFGEPFQLARLASPN